MRIFWTVVVILIAAGIAFVAFTQLKGDREPDADDAGSIGGGMSLSVSDDQEGGGHPAEDVATSDLGSDSDSGEHSTVGAEAAKLPEGLALLDFVKTLRPAAVAIVMTDLQGIEVASGSGFLVEGGLVVADHRVVALGPTGRVLLDGGVGAMIDGVAAEDREHNLALLTLRLPEHLDAESLASLPIAADESPPGVSALTLSASPERDPVVARGEVQRAAERPEFGDVLELTDDFTAATPGSPLINASGEAVGVLTTIPGPEGTERIALPAARIRSLLKAQDDTVPIALADYHLAYRDTVDRSMVGADLARAEADSVEATFEEQPDGSVLVDGRYVVRGSGTKEDPYHITWDLLASASRVYRPRAGKNDLPERVTFLNEKWVKLTGYLAVQLYAQSSHELLLMLNQWDGCCIGVPPTPYDAVEVTLAAPIGLEGGVNIFNYGTVTGLFKVDPYIANNFLIGLYLMEEASLELEM